MKNMKINFEEDNNTIKFEDYYFNGIPSPENIEIKNITSSSFEVNWKLNEKNIFGLDKNKINFIIELRKENEKFQQIYEGIKSNYIINGLNEKTYYEIRICSSYDKTKNPWTSIQKVETLKEENINFDNNSLILGNNNDYKKILKNWINPNKKIKAELLYRLSRDGDLYQTFHNKCDNKGPTLVLINDDSGLKTGGFTPLSWDPNSQWKKDNDTFIFNLTNQKKFAKTNRNSDSIYCLNSYGPWFDNYGFESGYNMKKCKFQNGNAFLNANEIIPNDNKYKYFTVNEVEVYKITFY